jgi:hypothetical protein
MGRCGMGFGMWQSIAGLWPTRWAVVLLARASTFGDWDRKGA